MKKLVSVSVSEEKLSAIEMYLEQKNTTLSAELEKYVEQIYSKNVPQNVRDFIDMMSAKSLQESRKAPRLPKRKSSLSSNSPQFAPNVQAIASDSCVWRSKAVGGVSLP